MRAFIFRRCVNINKQLRVNERIRVREVRLIDAEGRQAGIVQTRDALQMAKDAGLDLIEVSPTAVPPVCRIMDYGKFKFEQAKREKDAHKKSKTSEISLIRLRPNIDEHDFQVKLRNVRRLLEDGDKVRIFVVFRSREFTHPEFGRKLLERFLADSSDIGQVEKPIGMEGRQMSLIVSPKPKVVPPKPAKPKSVAESGTEDPKPAAEPEPKVPTPVAEPVTEASKQSSAE